MSTEIIYEDDQIDDDGDIYIMMKCLCVCLSAKVIFSEVNGAGVFFFLNFSLNLFFEDKKKM